MTEYSDILCNEELSPKKVYSNQQLSVNLTSTNCTTTLQCTAGINIESSVPIGVQYGALQYFNKGNCSNPTYYRAVLVDTCVVTSVSTSMKMVYPYLYEYSASNRCEGVANQTIDLFDDYCYGGYPWYLDSSKSESEVVRSNRRQLQAVMDSSESIFENFNAFLTCALQREQHAHDLDNSRVSSSNKLRRVVNDRLLQTPQQEFDEFSNAYFEADDDYWLDTSRSMAKLLYQGPPTTGDDDGDDVLSGDDVETALATGIIVAIVIGSVCGCCIIAVIIFVAVRGFSSAKVSGCLGGGDITEDVTKSLELNKTAPRAATNPIVVG